ncbi:MAG: hypothetical protein CMM50_17710 [Rhodospirillaceae bacterium]|nr:hypothetical protein [Rhodospirillaceae bacterium]
MVEVYFATNRRPNRQNGPTDFTSEFTPDINSFRVGTGTVEGNNLFEQDVDVLAERATISVEPERMNAEDARASRVGSDVVFSRIRERMKAGADAILAIHGYNYTFRQAVARAAQLGQWLAPEASDMRGERPEPPVMLLFSWPSRGEGVTPRLYDDERARARASGEALGRAILKATDFLRAIKREDRCDGSIHLLAHSMGNWALRGAVQYMKTFVGENIPPLFDEVILIAADEDDDTLGQGYKLAPLLRGSRRVTVYYNHQDWALKASDWAMGNPDRLGRSGPKGAAGVPVKVEPVNVSRKILWDAPAGEKWQEDDTGHQYYRNNPRVRLDLLDVLDGVDARLIAGRQPAEDGGGFVLVDR